jgi:hypothetical protein
MPLIYFEVLCAKCGKGLCKLTTVDQRSGINIEIKPCPECLKVAENDGYNRGFIQGCEVSSKPAQE